MSKLIAEEDFVQTFYTQIGNTEVDVTYEIFYASVGNRQINEEDIWLNSVKNKGQEILHTLDDSCRVDLLEDAEEHYQDFLDEV